LNPEELVEKFYAALFRESHYTQPEGTVSVTSLCFPCLRRAVIELLTKERPIDPEGLIRTWVGTACHKTSILNKENEVEVEWEGIFGRVDEYDPDNFVIIEKKTTRVPSSKPREHHVTQVEYYKVLLEHNGKPVKEGFLVYIDVNSAYVRVFPVEFRPTEDVEQEMLERKKKVLDCVRMNILPPREVGFWEEGGRRTFCSYCSYFALCFASDVTLARKLVEVVEE